MTDVCVTSWPYAALDPLPPQSQERWAVFFGADFYNMAEIDVAGFIEKTNQCLEYVRKNCQDCRLIYRSHPDEKKELRMLNLEGFLVQEDDQIAELFLWTNRQHVAQVFSVCSTSSIAAYNLGLNAHVFYPAFGQVFKGTHRQFVEAYFSGLPPDFFIPDLTTPPAENKIKVNDDGVLRHGLYDALTRHAGPVWFIVVENRFLLAIAAMARMIKTLFPSRQVNLVIARHHRWNENLPDQIAGLFHKIISFPRHFYSLHPAKLFSALTTARIIRNMPIEKDAVFIGFAHHSFIENCFISYHPDAYTIACLPEQTWQINFQTEQSGFDVKGLSFNKAGLFYNRFFEPLLGLHRTLFRQYRSPSTLYFIRLQKPLEEVYDQVYLFKNTPER